MFRDRTEAGERLAAALQPLSGSDAVVLALPRGGVVLGSVVASALKLPLDIVSVRKIGHPLEPEYAIGAVDEQGGQLLSTEAQTLPEKWLRAASSREEQEAARRARSTERVDLPSRSTAGAQFSWTTE